MSQVYLPGAEETTITQAVPPGRRHSITLWGSIPAVIPIADAPGIPTWRRGDHNHAGSSSRPTPFHYTSGVNPCGHPQCQCPGYTYLAQKRPQSRKQFLQADAIPLHLGGQSLRSSLMRMPRVYLPGAEETTIMQAVPPGRRHSITLRGSIPAVIPIVDAPGKPTWRRGDHNHAGSSSRPTPFHYTSGVNPCGHPYCGCSGNTYLAQRRPQSHRQFLQADAIPLHFGVNPCRHP